MHTALEESVLAQTAGLAEAAVLTESEARVLGCLLEKERTTPADYPLTTNSLTRACNQSSSRNPVVTYTESTVDAVLVAMKDRGLVRFVHSQSNRSTKYRHVVDEEWNLSPSQLAALCVLLLRGAQTTAEIKTRAERLFAFDSIQLLEDTLASLSAQTPSISLKLDRAPGQKDQRWVHLLTGAPSAQEIPDAASNSSRHSETQTQKETLEQRLSVVELKLERLHKTIEELVGPVE